MLHFHALLVFLELPSLYIDFLTSFLHVFEDLCNSLCFLSTSSFVYLQMRENKKFENLILVGNVELMFLNQHLPNDTVYIINCDFLFSGRTFFPQNFLLKNISY